MGNLSSRASISVSVTVDVVHASMETVWDTISDLETLPKYVTCIQSVNVTKRPSIITKSAKKNSGDNNTKNNHINTNTSKNHNNDKNCNDNDTSSATTTSSSISTTIKDGSIAGLTEGTEWEEIRNRYGKKNADFKICKLVTAVGMITTNSNNKNNSTSHRYDNDQTNNKNQKHCQYQQIYVRTHVSFPTEPELGNAVNTSAISIHSLADNHKNDTNNTCQLILTMSFVPANRCQQLYLVSFGRLFLKREINYSLQQEVNDIAIEAEKRQNQYKLKQ